MATLVFAIKTGAADGDEDGSLVESIMVKAFPKTRSDRQAKSEAFVLASINASFRAYFKAADLSSLSKVKLLN